jgi:uncharacterized protein (TIGR02145 family)
MINSFVGYCFACAIALFVNVNNPVADKTVTIGDQVWTVENLDVSQYRNGDPIPEANTQEAWRKAGIEGKGAWCYYKNDAKNGKKYGKLYNWYAINDTRQLAPEGFHVATKREWVILIDFLDAFDGAKLQSATGWKNGGGTNTTGFTALGGGCRYGGGDFIKIDEHGQWWTSTENVPTQAWSVFLLGDQAINLSETSERNGCSVRCVKN